MEHLFDFGISQEDALIENKVLDLKNSDRLLCITSAGDVPLNLLALKDIRITAVDISTNQNAMLRLKLNAAVALEPSEAAGFLGYMRQDKNVRLKMFKRVSEFLIEKDQLFWNQNINAINKGIINVARFEKYIQKFNGILLAIVNKKKLLKLIEFTRTEDQFQYFDKKIKSPLLKNLFKLVFHPKLYKDHGISSQGFINTETNNLAEFFFNRFRDFCCSTPAWKNYFLQYTFFNQVLYPEALPEFLSDAGCENIRKHHENLNIRTESIFTFLKTCQEDTYNKFHVSNIGDWVGKNEFSDLLNLIHTKSTPQGRISSRYIHYLHPVPKALQTTIIPDFSLGEKLLKTDRYPFYNIVPYSVKKAKKH
jgi:S-adenosylmethionine:diacylglycerol 3-amino-3-carboxypropyl transferase